MKQSIIKAIEDFLIVKSDKLEKAPLLFCFGFPRKELYEKAAEIYKKDYCEYILISGGINKFSKTFDKPFRRISEAEWQRDNLVRLGVPENRILIETKATNSLENVVFSKKIINDFFKIGVRHFLAEKMVKEGIICNAYKIFGSKHIGEIYFKQPFSSTLFLESFF